MVLSHFNINNLPSLEEGRDLVDLVYALDCNQHPFLNRAMLTHVPNPEPVDRDWILQRFSDNPESHMVVLYEDHIAVGYAFWLATKHQAILHNLYVREDYTRKGYGSQLLTYVILHSKSKLDDSGTIVLDVLPANTVAQAFYNCFDFKPSYISMERKL